MAPHSSGTIGTIDLNPNGTQNLSVFFLAMNGEWNEEIHLRRVNGKWFQALHAFREIWLPIKNGKQPKEDRLAFKLIDPGYPRGNGKIWGRPPYD